MSSSGRFWRRISASPSPVFAIAFEVIFQQRA